MTNEQITRSIGWGSIALGVAGIAAPRLLCRILGYGDRPNLVRLLAARDLVIGAGLIAAHDARPWLLARTAAEAVDTITHAAGAITGTIDRKRAIVITAGAAVIGAFEFALWRSGRIR